ncbi:hypothetical protein [Sphingomonas sp. Ag1]|jgi:hypothetical protein|uniref:hypothetical protein n=1 Tax=Sphingomonas sp. Ag1 TaxID=1642949 RepID=UPI0006215090|nr:hypothetical protein [Sphingomonas sp. Ag1]KKI17940.1 hypothetical protein XM50_17195 [Sphingomonas sp. Ag1]
MGASKPVVINGDTPVSESNPHSWLILNGDPADVAEPRCMAGTLRPVHRERTNSAAAFAAAKLLIDVDAADQPWRSRAYRHEVILPRDADDRFTCPKVLFADIDAAHVPHGKALLTYVTLTWTPARLHHAWRLARVLAADLVEEYAVPALVVQHVPQLVANTATPHCHILFGTRTLTAIGWGGYVAALNGDRVWSMVRARFDGLLATL